MEDTSQICHFDKLFTRSVPHVLERIFFSLDYTSLKASSEVCKSWNELMVTKAYLKKFLEVKDKETDLLISSIKGDPERVQQLLSSGTYPNCTQKHGSKAGIYYVWHENTPLHLAVPCNNNKDVVKLLLNAGADPNKTNAHGQTPIHRTPYSDIVQLLLNAGAKPNNTDTAGYTPLHCFATMGTWLGLQGVEVLLNGGADPNLADIEGSTPLLLAAEKKNHDVIQALLNAGADPNVANRGGVTPLLQSAWKGQENVVEVLLYAGADPKKADHYGNTPISLAAEKGLLKTARLLLDHGAGPNVANVQGTTPLQHALKYACYSYGSGAHKAVVKLLIDRGAKQSEVDNQKMDITGYPCSIL